LVKNGFKAKMVLCHGSFAFSKPGIMNKLFFKIDGRGEGLSESKRI